MLVKKSFPDCTDECGIAGRISVGECRVICSEKFDVDGNPIIPPKRKGRCMNSQEYWNKVADRLEICFQRFLSTVLRIPFFIVGYIVGAIVWALWAGLRASKEWF